MSVGSGDSREDGLVEGILPIELLGKIPVDDLGRERRVLDLDWLRFGVFRF